MYDIITIGSATRDVFVRSPALEVHENADTDTGVEGCFAMGSKLDISELVIETGGGGTNAAATFARLGWKTACVTSLGDDPTADEIVRVLKEEKISTEFIQRQPGEQSAFAVILLAGSGERTILVRRGAAEKFDAKKIPWKKLEAKWFYISSLGGDLDLLRKILDHADRHGIKVAWNPGAHELKHGSQQLFPLMRRTDVFNLNLEEAMILLDKKVRDPAALARELGELPRRAAIITDGKHGAYAFDRGTVWHSGIVDVPKINRTGAGDAFGSGLVAGLMKKDDLAYALKVGTWNGTGVVQHTGAKRGILRKYPTPKMLAEVPMERIS